MILTVTLNPAWDLTHHVSALQPGESHRVLSATGQAGGKGVNVSRVLHQMGVATVATGIVGGSTGRTLVDELTHAGVGNAFHAAEGPTRTTVSVVDPQGEATVFTEAGPVAAGDSWPGFLRRIRPLVEDADVVVLSGSLPPWAPPDAYGRLTELAHDAHRRVLLDADGPALAAALPARPDLVKPNRAELARAVGHDDLDAGMAAVLAAGAGRAVVTDGPRGMYGVDADSAWHARPPAIAAVNPTGAGDAAVAALAVGLLREDPWPALLTRAVAWSAAATLHPRAGSLRCAAVDELAANTRVRRIGRPGPPRSAPVTPQRPQDGQIHGGGRSRR